MLQYKCFEYSEFLTKALNFQNESLGAEGIRAIQIRDLNNKNLFFSKADLKDTLIEFAGALLFLVYCGFSSIASADILSGTPSSVIRGFTFSNVSSTLKFQFRKNIKYVNASSTL